MARYEVEIKSLLGSEEGAELLRARLKHLDPNLKLLSRNKQLNHYFTGGDFVKLIKKVTPRLSKEALQKLKSITATGSEFSVRTRDKDGEVFLVIKASVDDTTSANGITRMEFEERATLTLDELDQLLLDAGFTYQAKWSREREEYSCKGVAVCLDRNAGYGWLAEFEKMAESEAALEEARREVRALMEECGTLELEQKRLERMFAFYNAHWGEYYGTDKIFTIA